MSLDRFQILGSVGYGLVGNSRMVLQFGPRYRKPVDNTLVVSIFQATTGGDVSIVMDDEAVTALVNWFQSGVYEFRHVGVQTTLEVWSEWDSLHQEDVTHFRIMWQGSGRSREVALTERHLSQVIAWLTTDALGYIWEGWLKPEDVPPAYHGHVRVTGTTGYVTVPVSGAVVPCRLCAIRNAEVTA